MNIFKSKFLFILLLATAAITLGSCTSIKRSIALKSMASFFTKVDRNPVTRTPNEVGLNYEEVSFKSSDGVNLSGWYIPSNKKNNKLVIFNHFMLGNKAVAVPHKDWGNVSVDFMPIYKTLTNAGYNILTYDLRNHGESDIYKDGKLGLTLTEYQDVIGSIDYANEKHPNMDKYLYSQCYGTVATIRAMKESPEHFRDIKAFINIQPLTPEGFVTGVTKEYKIYNEGNVEKFGKHLEKKTGYRLDQLEVPAEAVKMPTLTVQVKRDFRTTQTSIQDIHNRIPNNDKELLWIEDVEERLEGYNYFARNPDKMLEWFNSH